MKRTLMLAAVLAGALPASASAAPQLVVWTGGLEPTSPSTGLELTASGKVRRLGAHPRTLNLSARRVRSAVERFLAQAPRSVHGDDLDGGYVAAFARDGSRRDGVIDAGATSRAVNDLLSALPIAAPAAAKPPTTAECAPGESPTEVAQHVPMSLAAARGLIHLAPKGPVAGDSVAVDGSWLLSPDLPVHVTVHLEIAHQAGDTHAYADQVKAELARGYAGTVTDSGQPVNFDFDVVDRAAGAAPRPCFHEVMMHRHADVRSSMSGLGPQQLTGEWELQEPWSWKHEIGHALGIDDHYKDFFVFDKPGHADIELPTDATDAQIRKALGPEFSPRDGHVESRAVHTTADDFMGTARHGKLRGIDAGRLAETATVIVHDLPGDILLNKDTNAQNLIVGAPFNLTIPNHGSAHVDGLVAYCIDVHRSIPFDHPGFSLDLLGRAGDRPGEAMAALQRVIDVVAAREPGPLEETPGAGEAIWRVTDDVLPPPDDAEAQSILAAAGIPADVTYNAPHFVDPAAAMPATVPVTIG